MIKYKKLGVSPSGKAAGSGPAIRGFESYHPSQALTKLSKCAIIELYPYRGIFFIHSLKLLPGPSC